MAQKNIKSVGNILGQTKEYWQNAAKQFIWPIDFEQLHISVPEKDLQLAADNLMVSHFKANGWHIQSAIAVEYTRPFVAPVSDKPIFKPIDKKQQSEPIFKITEKFKVVSTECELQIWNIERGKIQLKYLNRPGKSEVVTNEENLSRVLKSGVWIKL